MELPNLATALLDHTLTPDEATSMIVAWSKLGLLPDPDPMRLVRARLTLERLREEERDTMLVAWGGEGEFTITIHGGPIQRGQ